MLTYRPQTAAGSMAGTLPGTLPITAKKVPNLRLRAFVKSGAFLAVHLLLVGMALYALAGAWPHDGHHALFVLALALPGVLFRTLDLVQVWRTRRHVTRAWIWRLGLFPVGFALGCGVYDVAASSARENFEQAFAPLVAQIRANVAAPCPPSVQYPQDPVRAQFAANANFASYKAELRHDGRRFVLALPARALDVDGATIYYYSETGRWHLFHNDPHLGKKAQFDSLVAGMAQCTLQSP